MESVIQDTKNYMNKKEEKVKQTYNIEHWKEVNVESITEHIQKWNTRQRGKRKVNLQNWWMTVNSSWLAFCDVVGLGANINSKVEELEVVKTRLCERVEDVGGRRLIFSKEFWRSLKKHKLQKLFWALSTTTFSKPARWQESSKVLPPSSVFESVM